VEEFWYINAMGKNWVTNLGFDLRSLEKGTLRGAGTSPLSFVPINSTNSIKVLIKRIAEIGDKSKRV